MLWVFSVVFCRVPISLKLAFAVSLLCVILMVVVCLFVSNSAVVCVQRFVFEMTCYMLSTMLNSFSLMLFI